MQWMIAWALLWVSPSAGTMALDPRTVGVKIDPSPALEPTIDRHAIMTGFEAFPMPFSAYSSTCPGVEAPLLSISLSLHSARDIPEEE